MITQWVPEWIDTKFFVLGELCRQGLDRNFTPEFLISCTPLFAHSALPEGRNDFVVREFGTGLNHRYIQLHSTVNSNQKVQLLVTPVSGKVKSPSKKLNDITRWEIHATVDRRVPEGSATGIR